MAGQIKVSTATATVLKRLMGEYEDIKTLGQAADYAVERFQARLDSLAKDQAKAKAKAAEARAAKIEALKTSLVPGGRVMVTVAKGTKAVVEVLHFAETTGQVVVTLPDGTLKTVKVRSVSPAPEGE